MKTNRYLCAPAALCIIAILCGAIVAPTKAEIDLPARAARPEAGQALALLALEDGRAELPLKLSGRSVALRLALAQVWAPGAKVLIDRGGGQLESHQPLELRTYRGEIIGSPGTLAAITIAPDGAMRGLVIDERGEAFSIQPAQTRGLHGVSALSESDPILGRCGTDTSGFVPSASSSGSNRGATRVLEAEIALDADYEYYLFNNLSISQTEAAIVSLINATNLIFERDVNLTHRISTIIVRTSVNDPYSATDPGQAIEEFRAYWNVNHQSTLRDTAHLMTGRTMNDGVIGTAFLGVVCSRKFGYGFSNISFSNDFGQQSLILLHEIGHNWNAPHCDFSQDGCNIMCSILNACDDPSAPEFAASSSSEMVNYASSQSCLEAIVVACIGDSDGSGAVNFADITTVLANWLTDYSPGTGPGDANGDGVVNFGDVTAVLANWLNVCP